MKAYDTVTIPTKETIREARLAAGLTQREAAELARVTLEAYQRWEYGTRQISAAHWELFTIKLKDVKP